MLVYQNESAGVYLRIFAFTAPLMYLDKIVDGILKGLNEQLHYLAYNIMDSFIRVILVIILRKKQVNFLVVFLALLALR